MSSGRAIRPRVSIPTGKSRKTWLLAGLVVLGVIAGVLPSTGVPIKILFALLGSAALFVLIFNNLQLGFILFFALNLTLPQAGPTWNIGMQVAVVGETRGLHFNLHEIVIMMVLVSWLIKIFIGQADWKRSSPLLVPIILFFLSYVLGSFVGFLNGGSSLVIVFRFTRLALFAYIFFVFLNNVTTRKQLQQLVIVLLVCSTLVAGFGLMQKFMGQAWTEKVSKKYLLKLGFPEAVNYVAGSSGEDQAYRINSTFLHPNVLGAYMIMALPFFISLLWYYKEPWQRLLLVMGIGINLGCLFYTGSRAAWIAGGAIALIYGVFGFMDKRMILSIVTVVLVVAMVFVIINPPSFIKQRFVSLSAKEAATARIYQYKMAVDFFMEHPIFGIGMGMEGQKIMVNNIRNLWAAVENAFLTYLVAGGLFGFTIFMLLFIFYLGMMLFARNNSANDPFIRFHAEAFFLAMIGCIVSSQFGAWLLFAIPMWTMFWAFLGLAGCLYNLSREEVLAEEPSLAPGELLSPEAFA